jgi:hypothetical protein
VSLNSLVTVSVVLPVLRLVVPIACILHCKIESNIQRDIWILTITLQNSRIGRARRLHSLLFEYIQLAGFNRLGLPHLALTCILNSILTNNKHGQCCCMVSCCSSKHRCYKNVTSWIILCDLCGPHLNRSRSCLF